MKTTVIGLFLSLFLSHFIFAQANDTIPQNKISVNMELVSQYVWRGALLSNAPSIQPSLTYSDNGFSLGAWGATSLAPSDVSEVDLFASYTFKEIFTLTLTDYFITAPENYFNYQSKKTGHIFELTGSYADPDFLPLSLTVATNIYGADATKLKKDGSYDGIQYSTYAELGYSFKYCDAFMGFNMTPPNKDRGEVGFYGDSFGVVNLGVSATKEVQVTKAFSLPLKASLITNPQAERVFLVVGLAL